MHIYHDTGRNLLPISILKVFKNIINLDSIYL